MRRVNLKFVCLKFNTYGHKNQQHDVRSAKICSHTI